VLLQWSFLFERVIAKFADIRSLTTVDLEVVLQVALLFKRAAASLANQYGI
jgi:hypothetical protein